MKNNIILSHIKNEYKQHHNLLLGTFLESYERHMQVKYTDWIAQLFQTAFGLIVYRLRVAVFYARCHFHNFGHRIAVCNPSTHCPKPPTTNSSAEILDDGLYSYMAPTLHSTQ